MGKPLKSTDFRGFFCFRAREARFRGEAKHFGTNMTTENAKAPVRQLRLVVEAEDYEAALTFYRDDLGLPEQEAYEGGGRARDNTLVPGGRRLSCPSPPR